MDIQEFLRDRRECLLSCDKSKVLAYMRKYDVPMPPSDYVLWWGIEKALYQVTDIPADEILRVLPKIKRLKEMAR